MIVQSLDHQEGQYSIIPRLQHYNTHIDCVCVAMGQTSIKSESTINDKSSVSIEFTKCSAYICPIAWKGNIIIVS